MFRWVGIGALLVVLPLGATSVSAQQGEGAHCVCPRPVPPPTGGGVDVANPGPTDGGEGGTGGDGLIGLVPLGPLAAILAARGVTSAPALAAAPPADSAAGLEPSTAAETRAALGFAANVDSLAAGMRAPDTATASPAALLLGAMLLGVAGLLIRRPSA